MAMMLEVKDLVVDYGVIRAIKGINLFVEEGSIVAILGANGAGKTSTIRTVNGIIESTIVLQCCYIPLNHFIISF